MVLAHHLLEGKDILESVLDVTDNSQAISHSAAKGDLLIIPVIASLNFIGRTAHFLSL